MSDEKSGTPFVDGEIARQWVDVSEAVLRARGGLDATTTNEELVRAAGADPASPLAGLFLLWAADNCKLTCRYNDSIGLYDQAFASTQPEGGTFAGVDIKRAALEGKATALELANRTDEAIAVYQQSAEHATSAWAAADAHYAIAHLEQDRGNDDAALAALQSVVHLVEGDLAAAELFDRAKRDIELYAQPGRCFPDATELLHRLLNALQSKDLEALTDLASSTHFRIGVAAGHSQLFSPDDILPMLSRDLAKSRPRTCNPDRSGTGEKRYLHTRGWRGQWFRGRVSFLLVSTRFGWQWQGIILMTPTRRWTSYWRPDRTETNQPVSMSMKAPWPANMWFMAGGLKPFLAWVATIAVLASIWFVGTALAAAFTLGLALRRCGFGTRGFYYNFGPTHDGDDAFAIDFSRYQRGLPFVNTSGRATGNAVQMGVVDSTVSRHRTGSNRGANLVVIHHIYGQSQAGRFDPATGETVLEPITFYFEPYWSRYLHFTGPGMIPVSTGQFVRQGTFLGRIDDTGNSLIDHLHFSLHDDRLPSLTGGRPGRSVRPTPLDGETLGDRDEGKCIRSTNVPFP